MDNNTIQGRCPKCGQILEIPSSLNKFSCMYCGARLVREELAQDPLPEGDFDEAMGFVHAHLMECITNYPDYQKKITKKEYEPAYQVYERGTSDIFEKLDLACRLQPAQRDTILRDTAAEFLDGLQSCYEKDKRWSHRSKRNEVMFDTKIIIALFMVPSFRHLKLSISEDFSSELHSQWSRKYPKSPYRPGTYEDISGGFARRKLCFITTAVCSSEGKPDDCAELTAFRAFRDGYLSACPDGKALISEYYDIAPAIVTCIDYCGTPAQDYSAIRRDYLSDCYHALQAGDNAACREKYVSMVRVLERKYLGKRSV
jgi:DNA-directed RNA polymerase subunit RPC12/RpoP